jgi:hypothetical protein
LTFIFNKKDTKMKQFFKLLSIMVLFTLGASAFDYRSVWVNEDPNTRGITKLAIKNNGTVRAFGSCHPTDCDWGRVDYIRTQNGLLAFWEHRGSGYKVVLVEEMHHNRAKVTTKYLGSRRGNRTKISYFKKRNIHMHRPQIFSGSWHNEDRHTRGLTHLDIYNRGDQIFVHAWGKCHPRDCDWGQSRAARSANKLIVRWDTRSARKVMTIKGEDRDRHGEFRRLRVKIKSVYFDGRSQQVRRYTLRRGR